MSKYIVRIREIGEGEAFPEYAAEKSAEVVAIGILEGATREGKTGVVVIVKTMTGEIIRVGMTAALYLTIGGGVKGAMKRFGERPEEYA